MKSTIRICPSLLGAIACLTLPFAANAQTASEQVRKIIAHQEEKEPACKTEEKAQISVTIQGAGVSAKESYDAIETAFKNIDKIGADSKATKFEVSDQRYNISIKSGRDYGNGNAASIFTYNGNGSYSVEPASKATEILEQINKAGYTGNTSVSRRKSCR